MAPLAELAAVVLVTSVFTTQRNPAASVRLVVLKLCASFFCNVPSPWRW